MQKKVAVGLLPPKGRPAKASLPSTRHSTTPPDEPRRSVKEIIDAYRDQRAKIVRGLADAEDVTILPSSSAALIATSHELIEESKRLRQTAREATARARQLQAGTALTPPCPNCHRIDRVREEEQSSSSVRWFICERCGRRYTTPLRRSVS